MKKKILQKIKVWDHNFSLLQAQLKLPAKKDAKTREIYKTSILRQRKEISFYQNLIQKKLLKIFSPIPYENLISEKEKAVTYWIKNISQIVENYYKNYLRVSADILWAKLIHFRWHNLLKLSKQIKVSHSQQQNKSSQTNINLYQKELSEKLARLKTEKEYLQKRYELLTVAKVNRECGFFSKNLNWKDFTISFKKSLCKSPFYKSHLNKKMLDPLTELAAKKKKANPFSKYGSLNTGTKTTTAFQKILDDFDQDSKPLPAKEKEKKFKFFDHFQIKNVIPPR